MSLAACCLAAAVLPLVKCSSRSQHSRKPAAWPQVRELFRVADENAPSIVFMDEIDAIGTKRYDANSGGEREIQRTLLELLNQLDGFDAMSEVKVRSWCCWWQVVLWNVVLVNHAWASVHAALCCCAHMNLQIATAGCFVHCAHAVLTYTIMHAHSVLPAHARSVALSCI